MDIWFPWKDLLPGAVLLVLLLLLLRRQSEGGELGRTSRFIAYALVAAGSLWAAVVIVTASDAQLPWYLRPNAVTRSCIPFLVVWAVLNARELKSKAEGKAERLTTFAIKSGFAAGLAGMLLWDALVKLQLVWPRFPARTDRYWLAANGIGLVIYLVFYLGKRK